LRNSLYESANKTIWIPLIEPAYKINSAAYLVANGFTQEGLAILVRLHDLDPRNLDTLSLLADFSLQLGKTDVAISYREKISKLDPWNAKNYLELGRKYKSVGDLVKMNEMRVKINSFAPDTEEAKQANLELN
jgi:tetratricopeptide (TPR) repeat protein